MHGGTCSEVTGDYSCTSTVGYVGKNCDGESFVEFKITACYF